MQNMYRKYFNYLIQFIMPNGNHNGNWAQDTHGYFVSIKNFIENL